MKNITLLFLLFTINAFTQTKEINADRTAIESSKYWLDVDYVGDGIISS